jgi:hypothetical protein
MTKSVHINMRLHPKTIELMDAFSRKRDISRTEFIEDMLFMLETLKKDPDKLEEFVGHIFYEKYFKNSDR